MPSVPRPLAALLLLCLPVLAAAASPPADLAKAEALYQETRYAEAAPLFEAVLQADPDNRSALLHLGKLAAKRRDRVAAVDFLQHAVDLHPDDAELQFEYGAACSFYAGSLGTSLRAALNARRGRIAMERAVTLAPDNLVFRQGLLEFYCTAPAIVGGSMRKAHEQAAAITARDPAQGAFARANLQLVEKDYPGALATLAGVLDQAPDNYFALFQFGRTAAESGEQLDRGLAALQRCLELPAPDKAAPPAYVLMRIAQIHRRLGNEPAARLALEQAGALAPSDPRIRSALAGRSES